MRGVKGSIGTTREKHGHTIRFEGGEGYVYIDVSYDGRHPIDVINMYDYEAGRSAQDLHTFNEAVGEYLADLTKHDADLFADH